MFPRHEAGDRRLHFVSGETLEGDVNRCLPRTTVLLCTIRGGVDGGLAGVQMVGLGCVLALVFLTCPISILDAFAAEMA